MNDTQKAFNAMQAIFNSDNFHKLSEFLMSVDGAIIVSYKFVVPLAALIFVIHILYIYWNDEYEEGFFALIVKLKIRLLIAVGSIGAPFVIIQIMQWFFGLSENICRRFIQHSNVSSLISSLSQSISENALSDISYFGFLDVSTIPQLLAASSVCMFIIFLYASFFILKIFAAILTALMPFAMPALISPITEGFFYRWFQQLMGVLINAIMLGVIIFLFSRVQAWAYLNTQIVTAKYFETFILGMAFTWLVWKARGFTKEFTGMGFQSAGITAGIAGYAAFGLARRGAILSLQPKETITKIKERLPTPSNISKGFQDFRTGMSDVMYDRVINPFKRLSGQKEVSRNDRREQLRQKMLKRQETSNNLSAQINIKRQNEFENKVKQTKISSDINKSKVTDSSHFIKSLVNQIETIRNPFSADVVRAIYGGNPADGIGAFYFYSKLSKPGVSKPRYVLPGVTPLEYVNCRSANDCARMASTSKNMHDIPKEELEKSFESMNRESGATYQEIGDAIQILEKQYDSDKFKDPMNALRAIIDYRNSDSYLNFNNQSSYTGNNHDLISYKNKSPSFKNTPDSAINRITRIHSPNYVSSIMEYMDKKLSLAPDQDNSGKLMMFLAMNKQYDTYVPDEYSEIQNTIYNNGVYISEEEAYHKLQETPAFHDVSREEFGELIKGRHPSYVLNYAEYIGQHRLKGSAVNKPHKFLKNTLSSKEKYLFTHSYAPFDAKIDSPELVKQNLDQFDIFHEISRGDIEEFSKDYEYSDIAKASYLMDDRFKLELKYFEEYSKYLPKESKVYNQIQEDISKRKIVNKDFFLNYLKNNVPMKPKRKAKDYNGEK